MTSKLAACLATLLVFAVLAFPGRVAAQQHGDVRYPYILIDIGTLGGPQAAVNMTPNDAVTNDGAVIGVADTTTSDPYSRDNPGVNDSNNVDPLRAARVRLAQRGDDRSRRPRLASGQ